MSRLSSIAFMKLLSSWALKRDALSRFSLWKLNLLEVSVYRELFRSFNLSLIWLCLFSNSLMLYSWSLKSLFYCSCCFSILAFFFSINFPIFSFTDLLWTWIFLSAFSIFLTNFFSAKRRYFSRVKCISEISLLLSTLPLAFFFSVSSSMLKSTLWALWLSIICGGGDAFRSTLRSLPIWLRRYPY